MKGKTEERIEKVIECGYYVVCFSMLTEMVSYAYIDPSVTTYLIQAVAGVAIAVGAVEQMIRQAVRGVPGIVEMKASIVDSDNSITIHADIGILNGTHVPTVTASIQRAIRGYIEQNCGVAVRGVSVSVHSLAEAEEAGGHE